MKTTNLPVPQPAVTPETRFFWDALAKGQFMLPRCDGCSLFIWYPRLHCPRCHATSCTWTQASGKGCIYSFSVVRRTGSEDFAAAVPYVVAYVELDEGPHVYTNIVNADVESVRIGQRVALCPSPVTNGIVLPRYQPLIGESNG